MPDELLAAAKLHQVAPSQDAKSSAGKSRPAAPESYDETLRRLLGERQVERQSPAQRDVQHDVAKFVDEIVKGSAVAGVSDEQRAAVAELDRRLSFLMRDVLHESRFQRLEATWRGVWRLLQEIDESTTGVWLLQVRHEELQGDIAASQEARETALARAIEANGAWSLIVSDFPLGASEDAIKLMAALSIIAHMSKAILLAGCDLRFLGCSSLVRQPDPRDWPNPSDESQALWTVFRHHPSAASLTLVAPRVLARAPYGQETDAIESFPFEELPGDADHEAFLWGQPAFGCAPRLLRAAGDSPPDLDLPDLPFAMQSEPDGTRHQVPCAEVYWSDREAEHLWELGNCPLLSHRSLPLARLFGLRTCGARPSFPVPSRVPSPD